MRLNPVRRNSPRIIAPIIRAAPLARLEGDVAREPVANHDVRLAAEDPVPLHVPDVVEVASGDELGRLANPFVALDLFFSHVEKADPGLAVMVDRAHQGRPP